jgi:hypothetical protein
MKPLKPMKPRRNKPKLVGNDVINQPTSEDHYYLGLPVQTFQGNPLYIEIVKKTYRELTRLCARYTRVVLVRVDLHFPIQNDSSEPKLTPFTKAISRIFQRKYGTKVAYLWTREYGTKSRNKGRHYHVWFACKNHDNTQAHTQANWMQIQILDKWIELHGEAKNNQKSAYYFLRRPDFTPTARTREQLLVASGDTTIQMPIGSLYNRKSNKGLILGGVIDECFYAISYLAKQYSKNRIAGDEDKPIFANSNVGLNDTRKGRAEEIENNLQYIEEWLSTQMTPMAMPRLKEESH